MTVRLYHAPLTCSLASRLALIEAKIPHELKRVSTTREEQLAPEYLAINPLGKVPALQVDDRVITESSAILPYVASLAPEARLMPMEPLARAEAQAMLSYLSSTVHAAWTGVIRPELFSVADDVQPTREAALARLGKAFVHLEGLMTGRDYLLERRSVCDLYLGVFLVWRANPFALARLPDAPRLDALQARVFEPAALDAALQQDMAWRREG